jgi:hypothetical protein
MVDCFNFGALSPVHALVVNQELVESSFMRVAHFLHLTGPEPERPERPERGTVGSQGDRRWGCHGRHQFLRLLWAILGHDLTEIFVSSGQDIIDIPGLSNFPNNPNIFQYYEGYEGI